MQIKAITKNDELLNQIIKYTSNCNREAGPILAQKIQSDSFSSCERIFVAIENSNIIGYCTFTKEDGIPDCEYSPFVGFIFVDECYRGKRISEKMINAVDTYAKTLNFKKLYIVSDHKGLYEKYGFKKCDEKVDEFGRIETIFVRDIQ